MATFRTHSRLAGSDSWITASTDGEIKASEYYDHRVYSDDWETWMRKNPTHVIAAFDGEMMKYNLLRNNEAIEVTPPEQGRPWHPQHDATNLKTLPDWVIHALVDLGEVCLGNHGGQ